MDAIASIHTKDGGEEFRQLNNAALIGFLDEEITAAEISRFQGAAGKKIREGRKELADMKKVLKFLN